MAKRNSKKKTPPSSPDDATSAQHAKQFARLQSDLVGLLNEGAALFEVIAKQNRDDGKPPYDLDAEHQSILNRATAGTGPLAESCLRGVLREWYSGMRATVARQRVAYLGPEFSYSHLAAVERFGQSMELVAVSTIAAVFEEVSQRQTDFGVVPIENSTDGRIADTLDMFSRLPLRICGEVQLRIHHHLLGKCERRDVRQVVSKPQALSQCRDWIARHLPGVEIVETTSTTAAAEKAAGEQHVAAIASRQAGVQYGLNVLAERIEDNKHNVTRFAVIGNESPRRSGNDKTSIMFEVPHKPGAIADATIIFKRNRLNLTWIESFPIAGSDNKYLFFVEFEGHADELKARRALAALRKKTVQLEILGSYAKSHVVE